MPSHVAEFAMDRGFSPELIFTPERAGEVKTVSNSLLFVVGHLRIAFESQG